MSQIMKSLTSLLALMTLTSCGLMAPKLDKVRAEKVKRIAVLAFEIHQQQPKDALGFSKMTEKEALRANSKELQQMSTQLYDLLRKKVSKVTGWRVASIQTLKNNKKYSSFYKKKMGGVFRRTGFTTENTEIIHVKSVLDRTNFNLLTFAQKVKMAKAVGADAFAEFFAFQTIDQGFSLGNLTGEASFSYKTRSNLYVYGFDSEEPLWRVLNVDGEESQKSGDLKTKIPKLSQLSKLGYESGRSSVGELVKSYTK